MERNREARRGTTAASTATNGSGGGGGGLSRRRQRNSSGFRDSPGSEFPVFLPSLSCSTWILTCLSLEIFCRG